MHILISLFHKAQQIFHRVPTKYVQRNSSSKPRDKMKENKNVFVGP